MTGSEGAQIPHPVEALARTLFASREEIDMQKMWLPVMALLLFQDDGPSANWLHEVGLIISRPERQEFQSLTSEEERGAFADRFWKRRDSLGGFEFGRYRLQLTVRDLVGGHSRVVESDFEVSAALIPFALVTDVSSLSPGKYQFLVQVYDQVRKTITIQ